ncbi:MAG: MGMT family protein [Herpetosiphonaceae bacterium]|nr:MGMT family protein [Herpetosiphonaceae bacterium]
MKLIDAVQAIIEDIPSGQVWSYTDIAEKLGFRAARHAKDVRTAVVALVNDQQRRCPWWRVVANNGQPIPGAAMVQQAMLQGEGVHFNADGTVNVQAFGRHVRDVPQIEDTAS